MQHGRNEHQANHRPAEHRVYRRYQKAGLWYDDNGDLVEDKFLNEAEKYGLLDGFWKLCEQYFGYTDVKPTLEKLVVTMFVTYTAKYIGSEFPKSWKVFLSYKAGNNIAFMDNLMNNIQYRGRHDELSAHVASGLGGFYSKNGNLMGLGSGMVQYQSPLSSMSCIPQFPQVKPVPGAIGDGLHHTFTPKAFISRQQKPVPFKGFIAGVFVIKNKAGNGKAPVYLPDNCISGFFHRFISAEGLH